MMSIPWLSKIAILATLALGGLPSVALAQQNQPDSSLAMVVIDNQNQPIPGVSISLMAEDAQGGAVIQTTDKDGRATFGPFSQATPAVVVTAASANGQVLAIEPTTLTTLRIGLVPGAERPVLMRVVSNTLSLTPETLFSGANAEGVPNPLAVPTPFAGNNLEEITPVAQSGGLILQPGDPGTSQSGWGWIFVLIALGPLVLVLIGWLIYQRRRNQHLRSITRRRS